ncbi:hypothetical protein [Burkholderia ubonensis]|uniref:hypothetical protein n=1 Tax=Burkholderia ubonensis TaxID=101571 RepID=UPI00358EE64E
MRILTLFVERNKPRDGKLSLIKNKTKWVLFLSSSGEAEERHIMDLAFGLQCLESAGIGVADIFIYVDGKDRKSISQWIANGSKSSISIKESKDFFVDQANNTYEHMVMFVTGHGSIRGIDAINPVTPDALLACLKKSPNLIDAVVYLGQCHAGIFNYVGAGKKKNGAGGYDPDIIFIGATNLHESLSSSTTEKLVAGDLTWLANLFLLHVFKWISSPVDVDGDGRLTVMDSYKYAGVMSNDKNKSIKTLSFVRSIGLHERWADAKKIDDQNSTMATKLSLKAIEDQYVNELSIRYIHQECWILNSLPAQQIEY